MNKECHRRRKTIKSVPDIDLELMVFWGIKEEGTVLYISQNRESEAAAAAILRAVEMSEKPAGAGIEEYLEDIAFSSGIVEILGWEIGLSTVCGMEK